MNREFFSIPLHAAFSEWGQMAANDVATLDRAAFSDPGLDGELEKVAAKYWFEVARLDRTGISGVRSEEPYNARDGFGGYHERRRTWLDVSVPFTGDPDSFKFSPSSWHLLSERVTMGNNVIQIRLPDDDRAQQAVDSVIKQVEENLDRIRREYEELKPTVTAAIQRAAEQRKSKIAAEMARDQKLSFPVR